MQQRAAAAGVAEGDEKDRCADRQIDEIERDRREEIVGAAKRLSPPYEPPPSLKNSALAANDVDLKKATLTLRPELEMNPKSERFTNNEAANKLVTREYRKPYVVPEKV